ncbi:FHA domain-containing protein [Anaerolineae bacterium CFX9]|nr:FHA domain-containing protein [Anaerolineae bacterium CFX9]
MVCNLKTTFGIGSSMDQFEPYRVEIMIMSGVDDGTLLSFDAENGDGIIDLEGSSPGWILRLGRRDDNDICLRHDTFSSRYHARLILRAGHWLLEDCQSKNGTFIADEDDDNQVQTPIPLRPGQLFRVGRTWMRIQPVE